MFDSVSPLNIRVYDICNIKTKILMMNFISFYMVHNDTRRKIDAHNDTRRKIDAHNDTRWKIDAHNDTRWKIDAHNDM
jgi:hypothetical protein